MATVIDTLITEVIFKGDTSALENVQRKLNNFSSNLNVMGRQLGLAGGAITAFSGLSVKAFASFEDELAKIIGLVGVPAEQLANWRKPLLDIASATAVGPQNLAEALFFITSAGLRGKEAIEVLEQAARAQAAGMGEAKTIADLTTSAINAYGSENLSAADAANALTEAIRLGKLEPATMANAIGRVIPLTSAMNVEFNELAGLMAAMSKTGTPVEEAVTSIQAIMTTLLNPTREAEDALSGVGLSLADLRKQVADEGILSMLVGLKEAFDGNIESTAAVFGNVRALRGVLDLLGPQMQGNIDLLDEMTDSTGILNEAFGPVSQTIGFKMRKATVQGQIALLEFGRAIEPIARFIFDVLNPALRKVIQWLKSGNPVVRTLAQGIAILGGGLVVLSGVLFSVAAAAKVVSLSLSGLSVAGTILQGILNVLSVAWWRKTAAMIAARAASMAETAALWAMIAADRVATVQRGISTVATRIGTAVNRVFTQSIASQRIAQLAGAVGTGVATAANSSFVLSLRLAAINVLGFITSLSLARVAQLLGAAATGVATAATWAFNVAVAANPIGLIIVAIAGLIAGLVALVIHWDTVKRVVLDVWDSVVGAMQTAWGHIKGFFDRFGNYVLVALSVVMPFIGLPLLIARNWEQIVEIVGDVWARVTDTVKGWIDAVVAFVRELPGRVLGIVKDIPSMVADAIRDVPGLGGALDVVANVSRRVRDIVPGFAQGGVVPGPLGRPVLSLVHGGEMVLPPATAGALSQLLEGFRLGPAALPTAPAGAATIYRSSVTNQSTTVEINGPITIHTQATTAREIAQQLGQEIQDQVRNIAFDHDGPVDR